MPSSGPGSLRAGPAFCDGGVEHRMHRQRPAPAPMQDVAAGVGAVHSSLRDACHCAECPPSAVSATYSVLHNIGGSQLPALSTVSPALNWSALV